MKNIACVLLFLIANTAGAATKYSIEIKAGAGELRSTLDSLPYAPIGSGPVLYLFEFSECPYCQKLYQRYSGNIPGVEARHIFYAVSQITANETAALARSRSSADYKAFMERRKNAPAADASSESITAYNAVMNPLNDIILPTLIQNGWRSQSLVSPMYFWGENGKLYADGGYNPAHFDAILASVAGPTSASAEAAQPSPTESAGTDVSVNERFDLLGIYLGMSPEEVLARFKDYDPEVRITENYGGIGYFDGVESKKIQDYLSQYHANFQSKGGHMEITFSRPPEPPRAIQIGRSGDMNAEYPPYENFKAALIKKYGKPYLERERKGSGGELLWSFPAGETMCLNTGSYLRFPINVRNYNLKSPAECSSLLYYSMNARTPDGPVKEMKATVVDVSESIRTNEVSENWRKGLEAEARAARSAKAAEANDLDL